MEIKLKNVQETLLVPLFARAYVSKHYKSKFLDPLSINLVDKIEYDFSKFEKGKLSIWGVLARTIILDRECKKIISENPDITILTIGCGLDTRFNRIDNNKIKWIGLDFSEVIELRKKLLTKTEREIYIEGNALDENWVNKIKIEGKTLIILEGILMYFSEEEVKKLFKILNDNFPNAIILAEFSKPFLVKNQKYHDTIKKSSAAFKWGIFNSKNIEKICPYLEFIEEWNLTKEMLKLSPLKIGAISIFLYWVNNSIVKLKLKNK